MHSIDAMVDRYLNYLLVEKGLAEKTIESYSRDLVRFLGFLKSEQIHVIFDIDARTILKHLINLRDLGLASRTRARHLVSLRGFFRFLASEKIIAHYLTQTHCIILSH